MINEQPKCSTGKSLKYCPLFELATIQKVTEIRRYKNRAWRDSPLLLVTVLFFYLGLMVNNHLVLIVSSY